MNKASIAALVLACGGLMGCSDTMRSGSGLAPASRTYPPGGPQYSSGTDNTMPGKQGGFNNDDVNGKSRNAYSTTPGTGPASANPVPSGNVPR